VDASLAAQVAMEWVRRLFGGKNVLQMVEDAIGNEIIKRQ
jgi:hypothetical protein